MYLGRYDLDDCVVLCEDCKYEAKYELCNLIESGFWPGNVARRANYLFSFELFDLFDKLHKFMPGSSIYGFIQTIEEISRQRGRVCHCTYICTYVCMYVCMYVHMYVFKTLYPSFTMYQQLLILLLLLFFIINRVQP